MMNATPAARRSSNHSPPPGDGDPQEALVYGYACELLKEAASMKGVAAEMIQNAQRIMQNDNGNNNKKEQHHVPQG